MTFKMKGKPIIKGTDPHKKAREAAKKNRYYKPSGEVMQPPYKRPHGPTEKRHYVHKGSALDDNLDIEMRPRKEPWEINRDLVYTKKKKK